MSENEHGRYEDQLERSKAANRTGWLAAGIVFLAIVALGAAIYGYKQQSTANELASRNAAMSATVTGMQDQISTLTSKLNDLTAAQASAAQAQASAAAQKAAASPAAKRQTSVQSKRMKELQARLDDQGKQLKDTQDALSQTRSDLEGNISSTRDQLTGSIARTHEELVALEQRGERSYYEFDLTKSKYFQRTGPISVSLRKADPKHHSYDLMLLVDDNPLAKRNVDLYEPIWITGDQAQPLQIVVNKVDKNHVHGYVSAPKYPQARVVAASTSTAAPTAVANSSAPSNGTTSPSGDIHPQGAPQ